MHRAKVLTTARCHQPSGGEAAHREPRTLSSPRAPHRTSSRYVDQQTWKLQEAPESVPTGEMPRSIMMTVDRKLVDRASPGNRVLVTAIMSVMTQAPGRGGKSGSGLAVRTPYLQVLGVHHGFEQRSSEGASLAHFTPAEEEQFTAMSREPDIYDQLCRSIAPSIFGSENVRDREIDPSLRSS